jgi:hypothetical protein
MQFMERIYLLAGSQTMNTTDEITGLLRLQLVKLFHPSLSLASMHTHIQGGAKLFHPSLSFASMHIHIQDGAKNV